MSCAFIFVAVVGWIIYREVQFRRVERTLREDFRSGLEDIKRMTSHDQP